MGESAEVRDWIARRDGRAESTKIGQAQQLKRFLLKTGLTENELLRAAQDRKRIEKIADRFVDSEKQAGRRPAYAVAIWYAVRSFCESADVPVSYTPSLTATELAPANLESRRVPTQVELRRLLDSLPLRDRSLVLVLATSGVRVGTIGKGDSAPDGLRLENLPDLDFKSGTFTAKPPLLFVPTRLSKNGKPYVTALTTEAADVYETYLATRVASGEKLVPKSPLFVPDPRGHDREDRARTVEGFRTMNRNALCNLLSRSLGKLAPADVKWTAHTLRAWCSTRLESAEAQNLISRTRREFFLGRSLGIDGKYNLDRPLSSEQREELRGSYKKVEPFLSSLPASSDSKTELLQSLLGAVEAATGKTGGNNLKGDELVKAIRDLLGATAPGETSTPVTTCLAPEIVSGKRIGEQRSIDPESVGRYLESGRTFKSPLNSHLAIVEWIGNQ